MIFESIYVGTSNMDKEVRNKLSNLINEVNANGIKVVQGKKTQTDNKIKLIRDYVIRWICVNENRSDITSINFIDVMSNAGVYDDCGLGTSMEVLNIFYESARRHPEKQYKIYVNDIKHMRVATAEKVMEILLEGRTRLDNLKLISSSVDVNQLLADFTYFNTELSDFNATILFIDPYNFGTVRVDRIKAFVSRYYCEFIFNFFTSDFVRNGMTEKIRRCIEPEYIDRIKTKDDLYKYVNFALKSGKIKHLFSYTFKIEKNVEIYQMVFGTPNRAGLEKLKESLWAVFRGELCYRTSNTTEDQLSMFSPEEEKDQRATVYAEEAIAILGDFYRGETVSFETIAVTVEENTLLGRNHIINYILKPMISRGLVIKNNRGVRINNYTKDVYTFREK